MVTGRETHIYYLGWLLCGYGIMMLLVVVSLGVLSGLAGFDPTGFLGGSMPLIFGGLSALIVGLLMISFGKRKSARKTAHEIVTSAS